MHCKIHPPRPWRFPSGGDFAPLVPRDWRASGGKIPALGKALGPRGVYFPIHPSSRQCTDTIHTCDIHTCEDRNGALRRDIKASDSAQPTHSPFNFRSKWKLEKDSCICSSTDKITGMTLCMRYTVWSCMKMIQQVSIIRVTWFPPKWMNFRRKLKGRGGYPNLT